jgi:hypothetical protein
VQGFVPGQSEGGIGANHAGLRDSKIPYKFLMT